MNTAKKIRQTKLNTVIGSETNIKGNLMFDGGLHIDGKIQGNVSSNDEKSVLVISQQAHIKGEVKAPNIILNGTVQGDVHACYIELAANAQVTGNVYYQLLEMAIGAEINGNMVHTDQGTPAPTKSPINPTQQIKT